MLLQLKFDYILIYKKATIDKIYISIFSNISVFEISRTYRT
jgi:hypothetical protein